MLLDTVVRDKRGQPVLDLRQDEIQVSEDGKRGEIRISVEYRPGPGLNIWVPAEMKERYADVPGAWAPVFGSATEGTARYSSYRRFSVSTEEKAEVREP